MKTRTKAVISFIGTVLWFWLSAGRRVWATIIAGFWVALIGCIGAGRLRTDFPEEAETRPEEFYKLGEAAAAVYLDDAKVRSVIVEGLTEENGWDAHVLDLVKHEGRVVVYTNHAQKRHVIASRGTDNKANIKTDIDLFKEWDEKAQAYLHSGFREAAQETWEGIKAYLNKEYRLSFTGHSLGGAIAVISAMLAQADGFVVSKVVTFGQPKVTNYTGAALWDADMKLPLTRVVHAADSVAVMPMAISPGGLFVHGTYWHFGVMYHLGDNGSYEVLTSASAHNSGHDSYWLQFFTLKRIPLTGLFSHPMREYLRSMWKWVPRSKRKTTDTAVVHPTT